MYIGRFAPSPTGPLHFGSLIAAAGSYLEARRHGGRWLVRIDDLDPPREQPGAASGILHTLEAFGFEWDGNVAYQSRRHDTYESALAQLRISGWLYPCTCSRKMIAASGRRGPAGFIYPGTCRDAASPPAGRPHSLRLRTQDRALTFDDAVQGRRACNLEREIGDFNLKRRDGLYAYHLAATVDDALQGVTHIVRGADLLDSTPPHLYLQQLLGLPVPAYAHLPAAVDDAGEKLSKQTGARALDERKAPALLTDALEFLGQQPPADLRREPLEAVWQWAMREWRLDKVPRRRKTAYVDA